MNATTPKPTAADYAAIDRESEEFGIGPINFGELEAIEDKPKTYGGRPLTCIQVYRNELWAITSHGEYVVRWLPNYGGWCVSSNQGPWE